MLITKFPEERLSSTECVDMLSKLKKSSFNFNSYNIDEQMFSNKLVKNVKYEVTLSKPLHLKSKSTHFNFIKYTPPTIKSVKIPIKIKDDNRLALEYTNNNIHTHSNINNNKVKTNTINIKPFIILPKILTKTNNFFQQK